MASAIGTVKETYASLTGDTAKAVDLQKFTTDLAKGPAKGLTTDHGVPISDTDNWFVVSCP